MHQSTRVRVEVYPDSIVGLASGPNVPPRQLPTGCSVTVYVDEMRATQGHGSTIGNAILDAGAKMVGLETGTVLGMLAKAINLAAN